MPRPEPATPCPSDAELVELVEGRLEGPAVAQLSGHVAACGACSAFLDALTTGERARARAGVSGVEEQIARAVLDGPAAAPERPPPGGILGRGASIGRYLILSLLGRGGMGEVYTAYDPELDRRVAVKLLHTARGSEGARRRLTREARALGKLSHPNVVQVYDVGEHGEDVFVAMELVEGQSLEAFCKGPPSPRWEEVLEAYLDAARGLGAAHDKGIVHRDVKPSNILRGTDGRVRVADFGLAAARDEGPPEAGEAPDLALAEARSGPLADTIPARSDPDADAGRTAAGALLGTPLYMAPEQYEGPEVSAASDQHSLCTALYQGLYGALPFTVDPGANLLAQVRARKKEGPPPAPPAGSPVPPGIYRALARGLAPAPGDRHPSMDALAAALRAELDARRRPRWRVAAIGAAAVIAAAAVGLRGRVFADPCAHPERQLSGAWDEGVEGRVRAALLGAGRPYAGDTATRVKAILDRYGASWASMRGEVCEASRRGTQRSQVLTLREACLDRRLTRLAALTALLAEKPDGDVLDRAVDAAGRLPPVADCADTAALTARVPPPEEPALRARAAALQPRIDRLTALQQAGKYEDARALGEPLLAEAQALKHPALKAQVAYALARTREATGDLEGSKALLREASVSAAEGNDDQLAAEAWADLLFILAEDQQHFEEASVVRALGPTVVTRAHDERAQASWLRAEGSLLMRMGKYPEARAIDESTLALLERILPPGHLDVANAETGLARVLSRMGDARRALALHERALAVRESALGPDHPAVAETLDHIGNALSTMGEYPRARAMLERALRIKEKAFGPDHYRVGNTLTNLGIVLFKMGDLPRAAAMHERALGIVEKAEGPDHPDVAGVLVNLGAVRMAQSDMVAARALLERALAIEEKTLGPDHPDVATVLINLGGTLSSLHEWAQAARVLERSVAVTEKAVGPDHPRLITSLVEFGRVRVEQGNLGAALAPLERARALSEKLPGLSPANRAIPLSGLGELYLARHEPAKAASLFERVVGLDLPETRGDVPLHLAEALWQVGEDRPRARALAERAKGEYEHDGDRDGAAEAVAWLSKHPAPPR